MKKIIIVNWKMNPVSLAEAKKLFNKVKRGIKGVKNGVVICPPFVYLTNFQFPSCIREARISNFHLGAQNCHWEEKGAYTGEVSPKMLKDLGCKYVIIGHSERRIYLQETDEMINKKLRAVLKAGLTPILCVSEKKGERAEMIINNQLKRDLEGIARKDLNKIIIAYEPVWAIGTGDFCKPEKAKEALNFIKNKLPNNKVLYGGSINSKIAGNYTKIGFDGLLVGGASLDAKEFIKIVKSA